MGVSGHISANPRECSVNSIAKRDARAFASWYLEQRGWPLELKRLATFAMLALKTLDCPKPAEALVREAAKDLANFAEAYAAHMASQGTRRN